MKNKLKNYLSLFILFLLIIIILLGCSSKASETTTQKGTDSNNTFQSTTSIENHTHIWSEWVIANEATCTTKGLQYRTCECGATDEIEHAVLPHNLGEWIVIDEPKCGIQGLEERSCSTCDLAETQPIDALSHVEGTWKLINNEKQYSCIYCSTLIRTEQINISTGLKIENGTVISMGSCKDTDIIIPSDYEDSEITTIGSYAFEYETLTSIVFPETITSIESQAFYRCSKLENIHFGSNLNVINSKAFYYCTSIKTISLPDSLVTIGSQAFSYCSNLQSVYIGNSVTSIQMGAFEYCSLLTDIYFDGTIEEWNSIEKGQEWDIGISAYTIHCSDGDITK